MDATSLINDPVLVLFRVALDDASGARNIERVILFGSRARGDGRPDSDDDIAVFLNEPGEIWDDLGRLSHITTEILNDTGAVISAEPFHAGAYRELSPFMHEIRQDGLDL
jgi:uncharacterized protein